MSNIKPKSIPSPDDSKAKQPLKPLTPLKGKPLTGKFAGTEFARTITPQSARKQPITLPSTQLKRASPTTTDRKVIEISKEEEARKTELIALAKKIGPVMANKIEIICCRELNETAFRLLKKDLEVLLESNSDQHTINRANKEIEEIFTLIWRNQKTMFDKLASNTLSINDRSQLIVSLLIDENGKFNKKMLGLIKDLLINSFQPKDIRKADALLIQQLEALQNPEFIMLLNNIDEPGKNLPKGSPERNQIESVVRATLGLSEDTFLTATHSKQAILSAILAHHRQQNFTGSCFATCLAIIFHDLNPLEMALQHKQILENGKFTKMVDGEIQDFPIPKLYLPKRLKFPFFYKDQVPEEFFDRREIKTLLAKTGLDMDKQKDALILTNIFQEIIRLPEMQDENAASLQILPRLIQRLAMHKAGLEPIDFEQRGKYEKLLLERSELNRQLIDATNEDEAKSLLDQLNALKIQLDKLAQGFDAKFGIGSSMRDKFEAYEDFKQKLELTFLASMGENALLRSWEFAIGSRGRGGSKPYEAVFYNLLIGC